MSGVPDWRSKYGVRIDGKNHLFSQENLVKMMRSILEPLVIVNQTTNPPVKTIRDEAFKLPNKKTSELLSDMVVRRSECYAVRSGQGYTNEENNESTDKTEEPLFAAGTGENYQVKFTIKGLLTVGAIFQNMNLEQRMI